MKILLTGIHGQVGSAISRRLPSYATVLAPPRSELDLADLVAVRKWMHQEQPDLVINAAAYTAVDKAEQEPDVAFLLNAELPHCLSQCLAEWQGALVHYSTDYVFDGTRIQGGYTEDEPPHPLGIYGKSKRQGEVLLMESETPALIFRTSWVYSLHGRNFLKTMLKLGQERDELRIVNDQWGAPTWAGSIAEATIAVLQKVLTDGLPVNAAVRPYSGLYHMTNGGSTSWYSFTQRIFEQCRYTTHLVPISSAEYPSPVIRPANSRLDNGKLARTFEVRLPDWEVALDQCLSGLSGNSE